MREKKTFIADDGTEFSTKKKAIAHDNICYVKSQGVTEDSMNKFVTTSNDKYVQAVIMRHTTDWQQWERRYIENIIIMVKDMENNVLTYNLYYPVDRWNKNKAREWVTSYKGPKTDNIPTAFVDYVNNITDEYYEFEIIKGEDDEENNFTLKKTRLKPHVLLEKGIELKEEDLKRMVWDYNQLYEDEGEDSRWSRTVQTIVEVPNGNIYSIEWEKGLTEMQENEFYNQPEKLKKFEVVTEMVPVEKVIIEYEEDDVRTVSSQDDVNNIYGALY